MKLPIVLDRERMTIQDYATYASGRGVVLDIVDSHGEEFMRLTVNIPQAQLDPGEFAVKVWSENEPFIADILASGLFEDTGKRIPTGLVEAHVWRFTPEPEIPEEMTR